MDEEVDPQTSAAADEASNPAFASTESADVTADQSTSNSAEAALTPQSTPVQVLAAEDAEQTVANKVAQGYNCPTCFGEGLINEQTLCPTCHGTGIYNGPVLK